MQGPRGTRFHFDEVVKQRYIASFWYFLSSSLFFFLLFLLEVRSLLLPLPLHFSCILFAFFKFFPLHYRLFVACLDALELISVTDDN